MAGLTGILGIEIGLDLSTDEGKKILQKAGWQLLQKGDFKKIENGQMYFYKNERGAEILGKKVHQVEVIAKDNKVAGILFSDTYNFFSKNTIQKQYFRILATMTARLNLRKYTNSLEHCYEEPLTGNLVLMEQIDDSFNFELMTKEIFHIYLPEADVINYDEEDDDEDNSENEEEDEEDEDEEEDDDNDDDDEDDDDDDDLFEIKTEGEDEVGFLALPYRKKTDDMELFSKLLDKWEEIFKRDFEIAKVVNSDDDDFSFDDMSGLYQRRIFTNIGIFDLAFCTIELPINNEYETQIFNLIYHPDSDDEKILGWKFFMYCENGEATSNYFEGTRLELFFKNPKSEIRSGGMIKGEPDQFTDGNASLEFLLEMFERKRTSKLFEKFLKNILIKQIMKEQDEYDENKNSMLDDLDNI